MEWRHAQLLLLVAAVAVQAAPSGDGDKASPVKASPLDLLDDMTRSLPPDMADPMPPATHPGAAARAASRAVGSYRLPTTLVPVYYQIEIEPRFEDFTFLGGVAVAFNCIEETSTIMIHGKELTLNESSLSVTDAKLSTLFNPVYLKIRSITYDTEHDLIIIELAQRMNVGGRYLLAVDYTGILNDDLSGFYRSSYKNSKGETVWLATTQFETMGARRAFPCWDEPMFKARFQLTIRHDTGRQAISNAEIVSKKTNGNVVTTTFDASLPMSTYLVAFVVSDFASLSNAEGDFTVWARKDIIEGGQYSQDVGQMALKLLEDYTGIPYALPKVDQAAIPDFEAGAMENWGLVTYREEYLIEMDNQPINVVDYLMTVICHELAHQWTGNLVTLDWWSHTWLNEGFADYFENQICHKIDSSKKLIDLSVVRDHHRGMEYDALETTNAMSSPTTTLAEASAKFDRISYSKGGAVVRMWENMLGLNVLKSAMNRYLSINMFKNTVPEDLFNAMDYEAQKAGALPNGVTFHEIANTWTEQPGVPVVTASRDYMTGVVTLSQERFFYQEPNRVSLKDQRWYVPITIAEEVWPVWDDLSPTTWLPPNVDSITHSLLSSNPAQWIVVNPRAAGYYRVNYDLRNWNLLAYSLLKNVANVPSASRAHLISDAMALARGGYLDYPTALQFYKSLKMDREVAPWQAGVTGLAFLRQKLARTAVWPSFLTFLQQLTTPIYNEVGYSGKQDRDSRYLRYTIVGYACYSGNPSCIIQANNRLKSWLAGSITRLDPDTKAVTMCYGLRGADAASNFNGLMAKWLASTDSTERLSYLQGLACGQEAHLKRFLTQVLKNELPGVTGNDVVQIWQSVLNRPEQVPILFDFTKANVNLIDSFFDGSSTVNASIKLLVNCITSITSDEELTAARYWVEDHYVGQDVYQTLQDAFVKVYSNLDWYHKYYMTVADWVITNV